MLRIEQDIPKSIYKISIIISFYVTVFLGNSNKLWVVDFEAVVRKVRSDS